MGQRCCGCKAAPPNDKTPQSKLQQTTQAAVRATTSPLAPEQQQKQQQQQQTHQHPHHSIAGDLITCRTARKTDIRDAAIEDYVHL